MLAWPAPGAGRGLTNEQLGGPEQQLVSETGDAWGLLTAAAFSFFLSSRYLPESPSSSELT